MFDVCWCVFDVCVASKSCFTDSLAARFVFMILSRSVMMEARRFCGVWLCAGLDTDWGALLRGLPTGVVPSTTRGSLRREDTMGLSPHVLRRDPAWVCNQIQNKNGHW